MYIKIAPLRKSKIYLVSVMIMYKIFVKFSILLNLLFNYF